MESPLVSVIVVSYNHAKYIKENLDSIKGQAYQNIQLIVGDDASQDNSVEIFEQWLKDNNYPAEKNFHNRNTGLAEMLNECLELAQGEYIKIIAADDFLHHNSIKRSVEKLEALGKQYGMVFSHTYTIDDNSNIIKDIADYDSLGNIDPEIFRKELIKGNRIAALTVLMRAEALKATGKYDSKYIIEDYYRWLKINEKYLIGYIPEKLAYYRQHTGNISKAKEEKINLETFMLQMMFDKCGDVQKKVNSFTQNYYLSGKKLPQEYIQAYKQYPYHIKRLNVALQYKVPASLYKLLNKVI